MLGCNSSSPEAQEEGHKAIGAKDFKVGLLELGFLPPWAQGGSTLEQCLAQQQTMKPS